MDWVFVCAVKVTIGNFTLHGKCNVITMKQTKQRDEREKEKLYIVLCYSEDCGGGGRWLLALSHLC